jgi:hypothetical protein
MRRVTPCVRKNVRGAGVVKLTPVVALDTLDGAAELGGNKREKVSKS